VRFWLRWIANGVAIFLALYLMDSLLHDRFHFAKTWPAVVAAIILGFLDSLVRPLHRARSRPGRAIIVAVVTVLVNALILQLFVWVGADMTSLGPQWVLLAAVFVTLIAGLINWQVGFPGKEKRRPGTRERRDKRPENRTERRPAC
jgi:uncharacterized membrane protein YvlD (DUF360 family)